MADTTEGAIRKRFMRFRATIPLALLGLIIAARAARADDAPAASQQALTDFSKAIADGDGEKLKKLVYTHSDNEKTLLDAAVDYVSATKKLRDAVSAKFGIDASKELSKGLQLTPL